MIKRHGVMLRGRLPTIRFISLELTWFIIFVIILLLILLELVVIIYVYIYIYIYWV